MAFRSSDQHFYIGLIQSLVIH